MCLIVLLKSSPAIKSSSAFQFLSSRFALDEKFFIQAKPYFDVPTTFDNFFFFGWDQFLTLKQLGNKILI